MIRIWDLWLTIQEILDTIYEVALEEAKLWLELGEVVELELEGVDIKFVCWSKATSWLYLSW